MSIGAYYGLGCACNVCGKVSGLTTYEQNRYGQQGQEAYTIGMQTQAGSKAAKDGWVRIERHVANNNVIGGFIRNDLHICPACVAEVKFATKKICSKKVQPSSKSKSLCK
jgi:hypothetical protein